MWREQFFHLLCQYISFKIWSGQMLCVQTFHFKRKQHTSLRLKNVHVNQSEASALWQGRIVYSNWYGDREQSTVNVGIQNEVFMKNAATLCSILKMHYTHSRRKVEMLTFMLGSIHTHTHTRMRPNTQTQAQHTTYSFCSPHIPPQLRGCYLK